MAQPIKSFVVDSLRVRVYATQDQLVQDAAREVESYLQQVLTAQSVVQMCAQHKEYWSSEEVGASERHLVVVGRVFAWRDPLAPESSVEYCFARGLDMGTGAPLFVFWQFTALQVENLLRRAGLTDGDFEVELYGNLFTRIAYQMNMPAEELTRDELDFLDGGHPLLICVRVVKAADWPAPRPDRSEPWVPQLAPARWSPETGRYGD